MAEISELESRITAALDRIGAALETMPAERDAGDGGTSSEEVAQLRAALEDERMANAQLEERVRMIKERQDGELNDSRNSLREVKAAMERLDAELQKLRQVNEQLRASNAALREANAEGVGEPHLINKAMLTELEALRAARKTDRAENAAIIAALDPLLAAAALDAGEDA
jgi:predicted RNase H-like nuclease (RuvC/YqgF family)